MKKSTLFIVSIILSKMLIGQMSFSVFIDSVFKINETTNKVSFVEDYLHHVKSVGAPVIEGDTAIFIYYGEADTIETAGDFNGWGGDGIWLFNRIPETNFFYHKHTFESTARLDYKIIVNKSNWILDPLNLNTVPGGFGNNSELAMPGYVQPWEINTYEGVVKGTYENFTLTNETLNKTFKIKVYLPPNYESLENVSTVYVHDGGEYTTLGNMPTILDNLIDSNLIDPLIAVFITPVNRMDEYGGDQRSEYARFIAEDVVNYIDENFKTSKLKEYRLTMGASLGGNISGLIAFNYPDVFANTAWHSPAVWVNSKEVAKLYQGELKNIKIFYNAGTYEDLDMDWTKFADDLSTLGYSVDWYTHHEGHSWGAWRATIDDILFFLPKRVVQW